MTKKPPIKDMELWTSLAKGIKPLRPYLRDRQIEGTESKIQSDEIRERRYREHFIKREETIQLDPSHLSLQKKVRTSKVKLEGRVDLHGLTRKEALEKLQRFLINSQSQGHIWVLVITGRGDPDNPSTLRNLMPEWLEQLPQVSSYSPASQKDGGTGAWYVRLKRSF